MKARIFIIALCIMALGLGAVVVAQDDADDAGVFEGFTGEILTFHDPDPAEVESMVTSDGNLESVTADSDNWYGQVVTLEGEIGDFINARIFSIGEGAALDNDQVLVLNNSTNAFPPEVMQGARIRVTGRIHPSLIAVEEGAPNNFDPLFTVQEQDSEMTDTQEDETSATGSAESMVVTVTESDGVIDMPTSISAGLITFEVTNNGTMEHNFEIEGNGIESVFETNLQPGETRTMEVELGPGTYEVYCPVEDHAAQGMRLQLEVTEATGQTAPEGETDAGDTTGMDVSTEFDAFYNAWNNIGMTATDNTVADLQTFDTNLETLTEEQRTQLADALDQDASEFEADHPALAQSLRDTATALRNNDVAAARTGLQATVAEVQNQQNVLAAHPTQQVQQDPGMMAETARPDMVDWVYEGLVPDNFENYTILEVFNVENVAFVDFGANDIGN